MKIILLLLLTSITAVAQLPEAPSVQKSERTIIFVDYTATFLDAAISSRITSGCHELNPIYSRNPSAGRYWLQMSAQTTVVTFVDHLLIKRGHSKLGHTGGIVDASLHAFGISQTFVNHCF